MNRQPSRSGDSASRERRASRCCAASMPAPARSARWCSSLDGTVVAGAAGADAHPRCWARTRPSSTPRGCGRRSSSVLRRVVAELPDPKAIRGIAVASVGEAGVLLGRRWPRRWRRSSPGTTPAPPASSNGSWPRSGSSGCTGITGLCADPTFSLLKLLWYRRQRPELFARAQAWLNVGDYLAWRLCGERATDVSLASRTLLLDLEQRTWSGPLLDAAELPASLLPPLRPSGSALGTIRPEIAAATGLPRRLRRRRRRPRPCLRPDRRRRRCARACCSTAWAPPRR